MAPGSANPPRLKFTSFWQLYDHVYVPMTDKSNYLSYTYASVETRLTVYSKANIYIDRTKKLYHIDKLLCIN